MNIDTNKENEINKQFQNNIQQAQKNNQLYFKDPKAYQSWEQIENAIQTIYEKKTSSLYYQELYHHAYLLTFNGYGETTYYCLRNCLEIVSLKMLESIGNYDYDDFVLQKIINIWSDYKVLIQVLQGIFLYMDSNFVQPKKLQPIQVLGYDVFKRQFLITKYNMYNKIMEIVFSIIQKERNGESINSSQIKHIVLILIELGIYANTKNNNPYYRLGQFEYQTDLNIYKKYFEEKYCIQSENFYSQLSQSLIMKLSPKEYILNAEKLYSEEKTRMQQYLDLSSFQQVSKIFFSKCINPYVRQILENNYGLNFWIENEDVEVLKICHFLFKQLDESYNIFKNCFFQYVVKKGSEMCARKNIHLTIYIEDLFVFREKIHYILQEFYIILDSQEQTNFQRQCQKSFEDFINSEQVFIEYLNNYIDEQFSKNFKGKSDQQIEENINQIFELFCFIINKDVFKMYYLKSLSSRILQQKSLDENNEKIIINKFKIECGSSFTKKMEIMLKDVQLSQNFLAEYKQQFKKIQPNQNIDFLDIKILTCGIWPFQNVQQIKIHPELELHINYLDQIYKTKFAGRKLKWMFSVGKSIIKSFYGCIKKEFMVSNIQLNILLLYNQQNHYNEIQIMQQLNINQEQLKTHLIPLVQLKILNFENELYSYNPNFTYRTIKVNVPVLKKEDGTQEEGKKNIEQVHLERKYLLESVIVKIMKSRRKSDFQNLCQEVIKLCQQNQFFPDIQLVKQCLESLINRDYIKRGDNKDIFQYIA
ncbi:hypothetical protein IMG5_160430 [Ichthyophthirius multifiliis]|uniref:Cullin family profile domain-containing protein n=1 Tax=Ichthyophthirius multifiliis TaxID=5932 RepID=G0QZY2_ICHMU|nr:hypothetical protein IMG5_160430 [Ichthyophthirius multifiliis]EGR29244.1 hypothetical protein IMG5_160430 [Ichthyophthirius multifiliis]|eukprot:XP_004030480.1 hypothetical protein IMG5_160430 [Ichthyophthirius multifiliis]